MNSHLIAVEIGVVSRANERMNANRFALDQHRLESLNGKTVQCWCAVEKDRMAFGDFVEDVPDFRSLFLDEFFGAAHGVHVTHFLEATDDEWLEQNESHFLRQTALVKF